MPELKPGESEQEWMGRCVPVKVSEGMEQEQAVAACMAIYKQPADDKAEKKRKNKMEVLIDFKKNLERNGWSIGDDKLERLFMELQEQIADAEEPKMSLEKVKLDQSKDKHEIRIFPKKKIFVEKYNYKFDFSEKFFDEIMANFEDPKLFKPFGDEQHKLGVKFFDIVRLLKKNDGLYAEIELNQLGFQAIKDRQYSYISPQWGKRTDTDGVKRNNVLMAITLTNIPALEGELPTLQEQITLTKGKKMDFDKKLIELSTRLDGFKLQGEIDPAAVMTVLQDAIVMIDELKAKLVEVTGAKDQAEDMAEEAQAELMKIKKEAEQKETDFYFETAIKEGRILPAEEDKLRRLYTLDKSAVVELVGLRESKEDNEVKLSSNAKNDFKLEKDDYEIMRERGFDPNNKEDVKKYLEAVR
jgi:hypothetical protein